MKELETSKIRSPSFSLSNARTLTTTNPIALFGNAKKEKEPGFEGFYY
jgi:hypothetical protein